LAININIKNKFSSSKDVIIRHFIILLLALFFGSIGSSNSYSFFTYLWFKNVIFQFIYIGTIWNLNILCIQWIDKHILWQEQLNLRIITNILVAVILPIANHYFFNLVVFKLVFGVGCNLNSAENISFLIMSVVITLLVNSVYISIAFFKHWKHTLTEKEQLKRESLTAEFEALKNQINPHFLFNALNTLTNLIQENPETATDFIHKLSNVYRYVLTQKDKQTVTLHEELDFIHAYVYLNKIRFGSNLQINILINNALNKRKIVTLSLQMLVENAIKHNIISAQKPLTITIGSETNYIYVTNNLQRKTNLTYSNGIGLNNIVNRYSYLTQMPVKITGDNNIFKVEIPLLNV